MTCVQLDEDDSCAEMEDENPLSTTFIPQSKVLRVAPIELDCVDCSYLSAPVVYKETDINKKITELAYVRDGLVESVDLGTAGMDLFQSISFDVWDSVLSDHERLELSKYLPNLEMWNGLTNTEATHANVKALLSGENFHFGNPIEALRKSVLAGQQTHKAVTSRVSANLVQSSQFNYDRKVLMRERLIKLNQATHALAHKSSACITPSNGDPPTKRIRLSSDMPFIQRATTHPQQREWSHLATQETSLFLAIRTILKHTSKDKVDRESVWTHLQRDYADRIPSAADLYAFLDPHRYVTAALTFLKGDDTTDEPHNLSKSLRSLLRPFVKEDPVSHSLVWNESMDEEREILDLLVLEQIFRAPQAENMSQYGKKRTAIQSMRREMQLVYSREATVRLQESDPARFAEIQRATSAHPSAVVKRGLVALHPKMRLTEEFHAQERRRYKYPQEAAAYDNVDSEDYVSVGPVFDQPRSNLDQFLIKKDAPMVVTILNLVYDACARLPSHYGSRIDIRELVRQSQYLNVDADENDLDKAIAAALNCLSRRPPHQATTPPIHFETSSGPFMGSWVYDHAANMWGISKLEDEGQPSQQLCTPSSSKLSIKSLLG